MINDYYIKWAVLIPLVCCGYISTAAAGTSYTDGLKSVCGEFMESFSRPHASNNDCLLWTSCEEVVRKAFLTAAPWDLVKIIMTDYNIGGRNDPYSIVALEDAQEIFDAMLKIKRHVLHQFYYLIRGSEKIGQVAKLATSYWDNKFWEEVLISENLVKFLKSSGSMEKLVKDKKYKKLYERYARWLLNANNLSKAACKEPLLMTIFEFVAHQKQIFATEMKRIDSEERFADYLFSIFCGKTSTVLYEDYTSSISNWSIGYTHEDNEALDMLTNRMVMNSPVKILKVLFEPNTDYMCIAQKKKWKLQIVWTEVARCAGQDAKEACAEMTLEVICSAITKDVPLSFFKKIQELPELSLEKKVDVLDVFRKLLRIKSEKLFPNWQLDSSKNFLLIYFCLTDQYEHYTWNGIEYIINLTSEIWSSEFLHEFLQRTKKINLGSKYYQSFGRVMPVKDTFKMASVLSLLENINLTHHMVWVRMVQNQVSFDMGLVSLAESSRVGKKTVYHYLSNPNFQPCDLNTLNGISKRMGGDAVEDTFYYRIFKKACNDESERTNLDVVFEEVKNGKD